MPSKRRVPGLALVTALTGGELAFRQHAGGHTTGANWPVFLELTARYLAE